MSVTTVKKIRRRQLGKEAMGFQWVLLHCTTWKENSPSAYIAQKLPDMRKGVLTLNENRKKKAIEKLDTSHLQHVVIIANKKCLSLSLLITKHRLSFHYIVFLVLQYMRCKRRVIMIKFTPYSIDQSWILRGDRLFAFHARGEVVRKVVFFALVCSLSRGPRFDSGAEQKPTFAPPLLLNRLWDMH
jgi:hypothetical protein